MSELAVSVSEAREKLADMLDQVSQRRIRLTKHGQDVAYLISVRELRALEETLAVLENDQLMDGLHKGLEDLRAGRVRDAAEVFAELDAEFTDEEQR